MRVNEQADERMAQCSSRQYHVLATQCVASWLLGMNKYLEFHFSASLNIEALTKAFLERLVSASLTKPSTIEPKGIKEGIL